MDNSSATTSKDHTISLSCSLQILIIQSNNYGLNISIIVINTAFALFAVFSNLLVLITVYKTQRLRIPANVLLCNLAMTDLLVGLVTQPLFVAWRLIFHYPSTICSYGSEVLHALYEAFLYLCTGGSFLCLAYISTDRIMAVSKPLHYRACVTTTQTVRNITILWLIWIGFIVLRYLGIDVKSNQIITSVIAGFSVIYLFTAQVVLMTNMVRIRSDSHSFHTRRNSAIIASKRERRCAVTIVYICVALLVFLLPAVLVQIVIGFTSSNHSNTEINFAISALLLNSSANPLIYFWRSRDMRTAARHLIFRKNSGNSRGNLSS